MAFTMLTQGQSSILNWFQPAAVKGACGSTTQSLNLGGGLNGPIILPDKAFTTTRVAVSGVITLAYPCTKFHVAVLLKTYVLGTPIAITGTGAAALALLVGGPMFSLEGASVVGMTTDLITLDGPKQATRIASATQAQLITLEAFTPLKPLGFIQIIVDPTFDASGQSGTCDIAILAEP